MIFGRGLTVKHPAQVVEVPSVLTTVTSRGPGSAPAHTPRERSISLSLATLWLPLRKTCGLIQTVAPGRKPDPVIVTGEASAPPPR